MAAGTPALLMRNGCTTGYYPGGETGIPIAMLKSVLEDSSAGVPARGDARCATKTIA